MLNQQEKRHYNKVLKDLLEQDGLLVPHTNTAGEKTVKKHSLLNVLQRRQASLTNQLAKLSSIQLAKEKMLFKRLAATGKK